MIENPRMGELPAVFAHEVSHMRSHDLLWILATRALSTLLWFHPLVWRMCNAHTAACERVCDAVAADYIGDASSYSSTLAQIALATLESVPAVGGLPMARSADISARLRILRRKVYSSPLARLRIALAFVAGVVALAGLGGLNFTHAQTQASDKVVSETGAAESAEVPSVSGPTRIIHFPKDRSLGRLSVQTGPGERFPIHMAFSEYGEWEYIGQAIGDVSVPAGRRIMLQASRAALADLSPLAALGPNDLQWLEIRAGEEPRVGEPEFGNADETIMPHLQGLTGLKNLALRHIDISARGLRFLEPLTSLRGLWIAPTSNLLTADAVTFSPEMQNTDVAELAKLKALEVLALCSRAVTDEGIAHLAKLQSLRQLRLWCPKVQGPGLAHLAKLPMLEYFQTNNVKLGDRGLAYLKGCTSLKRLELGRVGLTDAGLAHFSGMTRLEELWFANNNITNRGLEHIKPLRRLKLLTFGGTRVNANAVSYLKEFKSLEDLDLSGTDTTDMHLAELSELKNLRTLWAGGSSRGPISDEGLLYLSQLQHLEELVVCGDRITARGISHLASIPNLNRLSILSETLDDDVFTAVAAIKSLTQVGLSGQGLTVTGLNQLNRLSGLKHLEVDVVQDNSGLDLSGLTGLEYLELGIREPADREDWTLRDEDMACLANLTRLKTFLTSSRQAYLTDAGTSHLAGLTELDWLSIGGPQLTDTTLSYLSKMEKLKTLQITGNFTDQGLRHLEGPYSLDYLWIHPSRDFSQSALQRLRDRLPNLRYLDAVDANRAMGGMGGLGG
jgi:Leucine-rich repeat (LRR) protein